MQKLESYIQSVGFPPTEAEYIAVRFKQKLFVKNEHFVCEGRVALQLGYVESGQFQYYSITSQGDERTNYISMPHTFAASLLTYLTETPASENIRALMDSTLWVID